MEHFEKLNNINVNEKVEKKKSGKTELTYLSWAWAWAETKKAYPSASYEIKKFENNLPYVYDEKTGYMVFTSVTIEELTHEMWLPVMDGANKAMKSEPYTYLVNEYKNGYKTGNMTEKVVEAATMFDINKTIMRCLTKNLAMFGLGLYIYAGEDLPESEDSTPAPKKAQKQEKAPEYKPTLDDVKVYFKRIKDCKDMVELEKVFKEDYPKVSNKSDYIKIKDLKKEELSNIIK